MTDREIRLYLVLALLENELSDSKPKKKPNILSFDSDCPAVSIGAGMATGGVSWIIGSMLEDD